MGLHLTFVLLVTAAVYAYRDIAPFFIRGRYPTDTAYGGLLWAEIGLLIAAGIVIPLIMPPERDLAVSSCILDYVYLNALRDTIGFRRSAKRRGICIAPFVHFFHLAGLDHCEGFASFPFTCGRAPTFGTE